LLTLILAGCGSKTVRLSLTFDIADPVQQSVLLEESKQVIERRLSRFEDATPTAMVAESGQSGAVLLSFDVNNAEARAAIVDELLAPYSLRIMTVSTGTGDLFVEDQGWFTDTGISQKQIVSAEGAADEEGKGIVRLVFSDEGRAMLTNIFQNNLGGVIGLFVHDRLMAKMPIDSSKPKTEIVIAGIPVPDMARIFADDVNVGTHVIFSLP
ncbi:MAG: hypothetical protein PHX93_00505, partial [Candidatus Peribacteraceae bacterium]|nr:hypothetical protein [Candidatus Peribacteraceae bacterium]